MKISALLLFIAIASAQTPPAKTPPAQPPAPKPGAAGPSLQNPATLSLTPRGPSAIAETAPETVVATVDGKKITAGEVKKMLSGLPPNYQQAFAANPTVMLQQMFMLKEFALEAEKSKIDQESPLKDQLEFARQNLLAQAEINNYRNHIDVTPAEQEKYYASNKDKYQQAKTRVIYVSFAPAATPATPPPPPDPKAKKQLTEAEATAKIEDLRKQVQAGADFGKIAKENSDDATSAAKDGEYGVLKRSDNLPPDVKNAVFSLKAGEVSPPVKQANGFYIFKVDEIIPQTYEQVKAQILEELKQARFKEWTDGIQKKYEVKVENANFFTPKPPTPPGRN